MIKAVNLSVNLDSKTIINSVSFDIERGEYLSIIGPNGAGKSTLLKSLCRIINFSSGGIKISGKNIIEYNQKELAKKITYIGQLHPNDFTVEEFILFSRYPYFSAFSGISKKDKDVTHESMKITYTAEFAKRKLSDLSSGERQRVSIASALAQETDIILFDEPVTHLDPYFDREISELIYDIHLKKDLTVIIATHNLNNALKYSGRVMAIKKGKIEFMKNSDQISPEDMRGLFGIDFISLENPADKKTVMIRV
ncbi:MAG: ABC transporter ATP-binding protein [Candidatus Delongbacteria bacterium]|nr:ABC transporter ATP-binding protein [Candidatus Delongbacteria bacterium]MCG2760146.1 ABC transporter ATP-binding protein [Candidatus Delongbacteria bacterium]